MPLTGIQGCMGRAFYKHKYSFPSNAGAAFAVGKACLPPWACTPYLSALLCYTANACGRRATCASSTWANSGVQRVAGLGAGSVGLLQLTASGGERSRRMAVWRHSFFCLSGVISRMPSVNAFYSVHRYTGAICGGGGIAVVLEDVPCAETVPRYAAAGRRAGAQAGRCRQSRALPCRRRRENDALVKAALLALAAAAACCDRRHASHCDTIRCQRSTLWRKDAYGEQGAATYAAAHLRGGNSYQRVWAGRWRGREGGRALGAITACSWAGGVMSRQARLLSLSLL